MFSALSYYIYLNYSEGRSQSGSHFELLSESPQTLSGTNSVFFFFLCCFDVHFFSSQRENGRGLGRK